jgi:hypothetical protein
MRSLSQRFAISALGVLFGLALSGVSVWGQERPNNTGSSTGSAVPRSGGDSGGGSAAPRGGGDSGSSNSGGSSSNTGGGGGSMGSSSSSSPSFPAWGQGFEAPSRAQSSGASRPRSSSGSGESTGKAVSRNGGNSSGSSEGGRSASSPGSGSRSSGQQSAAPRNAVPRYSRPNDDRPITGRAVERSSLPPGSGGNIFIYYPYYYPYGFWGSGFGYGLGYMYFDPFWYSGFGYGYGYPGYGGYGGGGGGYGYGSQGSRDDEGSLRLKIDPRQAQVYVDGYYVGLVDSFDGAFQKLSLTSGGHRVELKADGFEPLQFDVLITADETVTYKGKMNPIK